MPPTHRLVAARVKHTVMESLIYVLVSRIIQYLIIEYPIFNPSNQPLIRIVGVRIMPSIYESIHMLIIQYQIESSNIESNHPISNMLPLS